LRNQKSIPNDAKENMIDLQEKLESQVTECTAKLGEIKGGFPKMALRG
jgi:hypothetical protein